MHGCIESELHLIEMWIFICQPPASALGGISRPRPLNRSSISLCSILRKERHRLGQCDRAQAIAAVSCQPQTQWSTHGLDRQFRTLPTGTGFPGEQPCMCILAGFLAARDPEYGTWGGHSRRPHRERDAHRFAGAHRLIAEALRYHGPPQSGQNGIVLPVLEREQSGTIRWLESLAQHAAEAGRP